MDQTIRLDAKKRESSFCEEKIYPMRRGERNNVVLTVQVRADGAPYDLTGKEARLVGTTADGKLVGPCPLEISDAKAGTGSLTLPASMCSAVGTTHAYIEVREGETLVETTDSFACKVLECADLDSEQAAEFTPLLGELQNAVAEEAKRVEADKARAQAETERATGFAEAKQASQAATKAANDAAEGANLAAGSASAAAESANTAAGKAEDAAAKAESDVRAFVNAAGTAIGDAIAGAKADVDAAVKRSDAATAKADAATETADAANTAATKAVGDAQAAIAEVKATEAKLYPAAENILVGSETGTVAHVDDAFDGATLRKITVEGACKQDGTPSPDNPVPIEVVENPVVKVTGRNFWDKGVVVYSYIIDYLKYNADAAVTLPEGTYTISSDGRLPNLQFFEPGSHRQLTCAEAMDMDGANIRYSIVWNGYGIAPANDNSRVITITLTRAVEMTGCVINTQGTWIQVEYGTEATAYAPHVGTSTPITLPAEHPYLAKLPDGTADEIVVDEEGNVELVARVLRIKVPDGGFTWNIQEQPGGFSLGYTNYIPDLGDIKKNLDAAALMSERFESQRSWKNNPCFGVSEVLWVVPRTNQNDITSEDVAAVANGMVFYAPLATSVTYHIGKIEMPKAQDSTVNVWTDAEVTPNTGIEYVRDVNIVVANLEAAIASITEG